MLTYDFTILDRLVRLKRMRGTEDYPALEEALNWDDDLQMQCRIYEQVIDYAHDYPEVNAKKSR